MTTTEVNTIKVKGYKIELSLNKLEKPVARLYKELTAGKNKGTFKFIEGFYFLKEEQRQEYINSTVARLNKVAAQKETREEVKKQVASTFEHGFKEGDILYASWGYEQTNIDFYQITGVKGKFATLKEIKGEIVQASTQDSGRVKPLAGEFVNEEKALNKKIQFYIGAGDKAVFYIKMDDVRGHLFLYVNGEKGNSYSSGC